MDRHAGQSSLGSYWVPLPPDWPVTVEGGLSTRRGGVSRDAFASLNLGSRVGDDPARVAENLRRLSARVGIPLTRAARIRLEHGVCARQVNSSGFAGPGDILVTARADLPLALTVADCLPLLLASGEEAIALAHCGWRGAAAGVAAAAVRALCGVSNLPAAALRAWIGPGIGSCCFTLPADLAARFPEAVQWSASGRPGQQRVDLAAHLRAQLEEAGVPGARIALSGTCTACQADLFYSHRRDRGTTGRMLAWIVRRSAPEAGAQEAGSG